MTLSAGRESAIRSVWAWGNSVSPQRDARGRGDPSMAPSSIGTFVRERGLSRVFLSAPWAADEGDLSVWLRDAVASVHGAGAAVCVLGGDPGWMKDPSLAREWVTRALRAAPFDGVQLDVEPWASASPPEPGGMVAGYRAVVEAVRGGAAGAAVGADLPWWLADLRIDGPEGEHTALDAILPALDSIAVVAFSDHALGDDGVIALARPAATAAERLTTSFSIGVETDEPSVAGGTRFTFFGLDSIALEFECHAIADAFESFKFFDGIAVEHLSSWSSVDVTG